MISAKLSANAAVRRMRVIDGHAKAFWRNEPKEGKCNDFDDLIPVRFIR
jgi:hypothetical protein